MRSRVIWSALALAACWAAPVPADTLDLPKPPHVDWMAEGRAAVARAKNLPENPTRAKNVILFVGDGMGISTITAARILEGQLRGETGEENLLSFERFPYVALSKTYNTDQQTPDSAGTMTALVTGAKTRAGVISVDETVARGDFAAVQEHALETIVEQAEARGLATGLVTSTTVTHATPAALYAHVPERGWENDRRLSPEARAAGFPDIARQLIESPYGDGMDVVLGGGEVSFRPPTSPQPGSRLDGRDLTEEWKSKRPASAFVRTCEGLAAVDPTQTDHLLGLFASSHLSFESDRAALAVCQPSLTQLTEAALAILQRNPNGYFLMVEGGRIDHAHHSSNAHRALVDAIEFSESIQAALDRTSASDTLILVTADHGHVFMIGGYPVRGNDILGVVVGTDELSRRVGTTLDSLGLPFTTLGYLNGPGYVGAPLEAADSGKYLSEPGLRVQPAAKGGRPNLTGIDTSAPNYLQESAVPLAYETHSGEDVAIYANGPGAALFHGVQEQNYVYHAMVEALGWNDAPDAESERDPHR